MEPPFGVLEACKGVLPSERDVYLVAELVTSFIPVGKGWTLAAAVNHGYKRLIPRIAELPTFGSTSTLLRSHDFNEALSIAVALGDIDMAKTAVTRVKNVRITTAIGVAARCGQLDFLKWIYTNLFDACWGGTEMTKAARFGKLETLIWLQNNTIRLAPQHLLAQAARHLNPDILKWAIYCRGEKPQVTDAAVAADHGRLKNLKILAASIQPPFRISAVNAARNGHLHIVKWLHFNLGIFTTHVMDAAAQNGHAHIIIWLHAHRHEGCSSRAVVLAAMNGHLSVVQWLVANFPGKIPADTLQIAIGSGQTKVAQWLQTEVNIAWHGNFVVCAARHSCRELVAWTLALFPDQCTAIAMDNAVLVGNRELFYELHHAGKACTSDAIDHFAARGELAMVRWAIANRTEGCSTNAMDEAATNGHLEVVEFLHGIGATCTVRAMDGAAANGHIDILKWLFTNRSEGCSFDAMDDAADRGQSKTIEWLHEHGARCTERAMDTAAGQGRFKIVVFLHDKRNEGCSRRASVWAADYGHLQILQWLRINYPSKYDIHATLRAAPTHGWNAEIVQELCDF